MQILKEITSKYGASNLSRLSGIPRMTIEKWKRVDTEYLRPATKKKLVSFLEKEQVEIYQWKERLSTL